MSVRGCACVCVCVSRVREAARTCMCMSGTTPAAKLTKNSNTMAPHPNLVPINPYSSLWQFFLFTLTTKECRQIFMDRQGQIRSICNILKHFPHINISLVDLHVLKTVCVCVCMCVSAQKRERAPGCSPSLQGRGASSKIESCHGLVHRLCQHPQQIKPPSLIACSSSQ